MQWATRCQVTQASFDLMVQYFIASTERCGKLRKLDKNTLEAGASMAALILAVVQELQVATPLASNHLDKLVAAFVAGDPGLEVELQCATSEKSPTWDPRNLQTVTELIREHCAATELARIPDAAETVKIQAGPPPCGALH